MKTITQYFVSSLLIVIALPDIGFTQSFSINTDGSTAHNSAILDIKSTTKGLLIPRLTTVQKLAIINPAEGLNIYDTDTKSFWFYNGTDWFESAVTTTTAFWNAAGNTGTNPAIHFIGTADANDLVLRTNNMQRMTIRQNGTINLNAVDSNMIIGDSAGAVNTGIYNHFIGYHAGKKNTTGYYNYFSGNEAGGSNTTGIINHFEGLSAGYLNTTGSFNYFSGVGAGYNNNGSDNYFSGYFAGYKNTTGIENYFSGNYAGSENTIGRYNHFSGYWAGYNNTRGEYNTAIGYKALFTDTTGFGNTALGAKALYSNTLGNYNTALGLNALYGNKNGNFNIAVGFEALYSNTSGYGNITVGFQSLYFNTTGNHNTAVGNQALPLNSTGKFNTAVGSLAIYYHRNGDYNTAIGMNALYIDTSGVSNTALGYGTLYNNLNGYNNTAVGVNALQHNKGGYNNIALGVNSGINPATPNIYNTVSIGNDDVLNASQNQVLIGNTSIVWIGGKVTWSTYSDARIKNTIAEDVKGLDFISRLRPVTYHISNKAITSITGNKETPDFAGKYDGEKIKYTGFIAQEVEQAAKAANYDFSGYAAPKNQWGLYSISYEQFVVPLVKAVQEQQQIIDLLQKEVEAVKAEIPIQIGKQQIIIEELKKKMELQEKRLATLETKN